MPIVIGNGRVIDPSSNTDRVADVLIVDGRVAGVAPNHGSAPTIQPPHQHDVDFAAAPDPATSPAVAVAMHRYRPLSRAGLSSSPARRRIPAGVDLQPDGLLVVGGHAGVEAGPEHFAGFRAWPKTLDDSAFSDACLAAVLECYGRQKYELSGARCGCGQRGRWGIAKDNKRLQPRRLDVQSITIDAGQESRTEIWRGTINRDE